jgi:hypothetical protein
LRLVEPAQTHLGALADRLDTAWLDLSARLGPVEHRDKNAPVRLEPDADGRVRLHLGRLEALEALDEPQSLTGLRDLVDRMLPRVDLPEVLLEVHAWTGYLGEFTHLAEAGSRMADLATSMAAVLIAEGCNLGLAPVVKPGHRLARKIFHGRRGEIRRAYREGQEDQLGALGLVLNAVVLWNTRYTDAALAALREQGHPVRDIDAARLSPVGDAHINVHGRYTFTPPPEQGLRPLRDPISPAGEEDNF